MPPKSFLQIVLKERPTGNIDPAKTFASQTVDYSSLGAPAAGQVLVKVTWLSLDPAMRGWLNDTRSYVPPVKIDEVMRAGGLGVIEQVGPNSKLSKGDIVSGTFGWTEYVIVKEKAVEKIE